MTLEELPSNDFGSVRVVGRVSGRVIDLVSYAPHPLRPLLPSPSFFSVYRSSMSPSDKRGVGSVLSLKDNKTNPQCINFSNTLFMKNFSLNPIE